MRLRRSFWQELETVVKQRPEYTPAWVALAEVASRSRDFAGCQRYAEGRYSDAEKKFSGHYDPTHRDFSRAIPLLERARTLPPADWRATYLLG